MSIETTKIVKSNINNCIPKSTGEKIKEIRSITGLSQAKFSNEYHIPLKTLTQWEQNCAKCPDYVIELLEFKVKYDYSR
jgi:DNA-binding transcriptional regulator YiaG